jgi:hypothetical protein
MAQSLAAAHSSPLRHLIARRPLRDGSALGERGSEQHFLTVGGFSGHGTNWPSVAAFHRGSSRPRSRFSAQGPGWPARPRGASNVRLKQSWRFCSGEMAADGSKRQFLERASTILALRDTIDNDYFRRPRKLNSLFKACSLTMKLYRRGPPIRVAPSRMNRALRSAFRTSHRRRFACTPQARELCCVPAQGVSRNRNLLRAHFNAYG